MKTKFLTIIALALLIAGTAKAQNKIQQVLDQIETNNTSLKALREQVKADKILNKTGLTLADPEVEFAYLWGTPGNIGNRRDLSVTQSFDLATLSGAKKRVAEKENELLDISYKQERMTILQEAREILTELVYQNAMIRELEQRKINAEILAKAYRERLSNGDANILEVNKTTLNLSTIEAELAQAAIEHRALSERLQTLNGGVMPIYDASAYETGIDGEFNEWYEQAQAVNPALQYLRGEIEANEERVNLNKKQGLPSFSTGYTSEIVAGQSYRGVSVGISIPLWSNKNKVRQAKAALKASESRMYDAKTQFYYSLKSLYNKTRELQNMATGYRNALKKLNNEVLLEKALKAGQISLLEYMMEMSLYYDAVNKALVAEKDYRLSEATLLSLIKN